DQSTTGHEVPPFPNLRAERRRSQPGTAYNNDRYKSVFSKIPSPFFFAVSRARPFVGERFHHRGRVPQTSASTEVGKEIGRGRIQPGEIKKAGRAEPFRPDH